MTVDITTHKPPRKKEPKELAVVHQSGCTGCEACIAFCPVDCIEIVPGLIHPAMNRLVEIDLDRCIGRVRGDGETAIAARAGARPEGHGTLGWARPRPSRKGGMPGRRRRRLPAWCARSRDPVTTERPLPPATADCQPAPASAIHRIVEERTQPRS
jgi:hypothetical protein